MDKQTQEALKMAGYDLEGVIEDVENFDGFDDVCLQTIKRVRSVIDEALATNKESSLVQPAQEPVAWMSQGGMLTTERLQAESWVSHGGKATPLYPHSTPDSTPAIEQALGNQEGNKESNQQLAKLTRLEVIDNNGRAYVNMAIDKLEFSYQDDGRTLKIFTNGAGKLQPAQEPVAVKNANGITLKQGWDDLPDDTLLYTHPHQWQELTNEDIARLILINEVDGTGDVGLARLVEHASRIKNHG